MLSIRRAFTLVGFLVVLAIISILAALSFAISARRFRSQMSDSCLSNLTQISISVKLYNQDYDHKFPVVSWGNEKGWCDSLQPYGKNLTAYHCPSTPYVEGRIGFFYNRRLAQLEEAEIVSISKTIMIGEGSPDSPHDNSLSSLPVQWVQDSNSPVKRHLNGANYAFVDGHVKWMTPEKVTLDKPTKTGAFTFLTR